MARTCPASLSLPGQKFFTDMAALTRAYAFLAGKHAALFLLDLDRLARLLARRNSAEELRAVLTGQEAALFDGFSFAKRRLEWLGGRLAAKCCLYQCALRSGLSPDLVAQSSILPDAKGIPIVHSPHAFALDPRLSLSHSQGYAVALLTLKRSCGVDIQRKTDKLHGIRKRLVLPEEEELLEPMNDDLQALTMLWASKEAVKKSLLPTEAGFVESVRAESMRYDPLSRCWRVLCLTTRDTKPRQALVRLAWHQDYCIACTTGAKHA